MSQSESLFSWRRGTTEVIPGGKELTPKELLRLQRLGRELRLTDQILSDDLDKVSIVGNGPAPAWTNLDGDHVSFNLDQMPKPVSKLDVAIWLGTNAHELGHVLFSPRSGSMLMRQVVSAEAVVMRGVSKLHNIVEDQRQERLILSRFSPWRDYLVAALGHHLVTDDQSAWLLIAGRTWLPKSVRHNVREQFAAYRSVETADRVAELIGDYQRLTDPGELEYDEAWSILTELHALFEDDMPTMPQPCGVMEGGEPRTDQPGPKAPASADEVDDDDDELDESDEDADQFGGGSDSFDDDDGDDESPQPQSRPSQAPPDDDAPEPEPSDGEAEGATAGTESGDPTEAPPPDLNDQLKRAAESNLDKDEDAKADLDAVMDALDHGNGSEEASGDRTPGHYDEVSDAARRLSHEVGDALLDLKDQSEPGWLKRVDSGRLNVKRLFTVDDPSAWFDRYEPGQMDASELEVVLLLDVSGSMSSSLYRVAEATWAIREAVDDLEGACTVIAFDSGPPTVMCQPGDRPDDRMFVPDARGGTVPTDALRKAFSVLSESQAKNRLMIVLTDGSWGAPQQAESIIEAMNVEGVTTVLAFLRGWAPSTNESVDTHGCTFAEDIGGDAATLAILFRRIASTQIAAWL